MGTVVSVGVVIEDGRLTDVLAKAKATAEIIHTIVVSLARDFFVVARAGGCNFVGEGGITAFPVSGISGVGLEEGAAEGVFEFPADVAGISEAGTDSKFVFIFQQEVPRNTADGVNGERVDGSEGDVGTITEIRRGEVFDLFWVGFVVTEVGGLEWGGVDEGRKDGCGGDGKGVLLFHDVVRAGYDFDLKVSMNPSPRNVNVESGVGFRFEVTGDQ